MSPTVRANIIAILMVGLFAAGKAQDCVPRSFGYSSVVCVCNSTFCDSASVNVPAKGQYQSYESNQSGKRMSQETGSFVNETSADNDVNRIMLAVNPSIKYQMIFGFGGAFTDSVGINMQTLSAAAQTKIMEAYFGVNGSRYSLGRVPIGGSDFSTKPYTYDDEDDVKLENFTLANEDYEYKIPYMKRALELNPEMRFISAAWTAPPWMKSNGAFTGYGYLKDEYYQTYADYLLKFLLEYENQGLKIWAISTGNEPTDSYVPSIITFSTMAWTPRTMAIWVGNNLGPTLAASTVNDTKILIIDDQRFDLPWYPIDVFNNSDAKKYIAGIAIHWYWEFLITPNVLDITHNLFPDKFLIMTEACIGSLPWDIPKVRLGDWQRGGQYITSIMEDLNHWMTGWVDWNLVLDKQGGPNWVKNFVDAPILVNPETDEFFKQPTYYALAHFSKFVTPGSTRIDITQDGTIRTMAFLTPDNETVLVLYNPNNEERDVSVTDPEEGIISITMSALSIRTIIYKR